MKKVAIIFNQAPHGNSQGREALDLVLALSDINQISVFFTGDGVFHLLQNQQPDSVLMRDYIATFGMLELYDITGVYVSQTSLSARNLSSQPLSIHAKISTQQEITELLAKQDSILQF